LQLIVEINADFDLRLALMGGQTFRWQPQGGGYRGVVGGLLLQVEHFRDVFEVQVLNASHLSHLAEDEIGQYVEKYFRVDEDPEGVRSALCKDPVLAPIVQELGGIRILRQDPWECIVSYICSIDSNIPKIRTNVASICRALGEEIPVAAEWMEYSFPTIRAVADSSEDLLRSMGVGFRAPYLLKTAQELRDSKWNFMDMKNENAAKVRSDLQSLPGIGPKVADCILLYSLDHLDAFPIDRWVRRTVSQLYFKGEEIRDKEIKEWAFTRFGFHSGYAQQYLFEWGRLQKITSG
jgi:N-glycosylase/DNA lyase